MIRSRDKDGDNDKGVGIGLGIVIGSRDWAEDGDNDIDKE